MGLMNRVLHLQALKIEADEAEVHGVEDPSGVEFAPHPDAGVRTTGSPEPAKTSSQSPSLVSPASAITATASTPPASAQGAGFLTRAAELRSKPGQFDPRSEEVLVQLIEAVPSVSDGFSGLYQTFHLIRDLLGFSKLMLLTPGEEDSAVFEPLYSYGFDKTTRSRLAVQRTSLPRNFRYMRLGQQLVQTLSEHDRSSATDPFYVIGFGRPQLFGLLVGTSPYTSLQEAGSPILGPVSQLLDLHFPRFVGQSTVQETEVRLIPFEDLKANLGPADLLVELDLNGFLSAITDLYADLLGHRASELLALQTLRFLPTGTLASWKDSETFVVHVPVSYPKVQEVIASQLAAHLRNWFSIDESAQFVRTVASSAT